MFAISKKKEGESFLEGKLYLCFGELLLCARSSTGCLYVILFDSHNGLVGMSPESHFAHQDTEGQGG